MVEKKCLEKRKTSEEALYNRSELDNGAVNRMTRK